MAGKSMALGGGGRFAAIEAARGKGAAIAAGQAKYGKKGMSALAHRGTAGAPAARAQAKRIARGGGEESGPHERTESPAVERAEGAGPPKRGAAKMKAGKRRFGTPARAKAQPFGGGNPKVGAINSMLAQMGGGGGPQQPGY